MSRIFTLFLCLCLATACSLSAAESDAEFSKDRNRLLAYILSQQLPGHHFRQTPMNDELSRAAFALYLKQLDPRKRFLLAADVDQLRSFADHLDDELGRGKIILPDVGKEILTRRVNEVRGFVDALLDQGFAVEKEESLETDPKKLDYAKDQASLRQRWQKIVRYSVLDRYLDLVEEKAEEKEEAESTEIDASLMEAAVASAKKRIHRNLDRVLQETRQDHYHRYFDAVGRAFDPHTNYMPPETKEDFDIHMSGSLEGIGALLKEDDGLIKVVRIIVGGAADRQGQLMAEDTILAVAEKDEEAVEISDMRIHEAVHYIRGPKGTEVRLTVQRPDGTRLVIPIIRDVVQIEEAYVKSTVLDAGKGKKIGYIRVPSFYHDFSRTQGEARNVTDDTLAALEQLKERGIFGLILDLRNNGGGALTDAVELSGLFLPGGPVVQVKNSRGKVRILADDDPGVFYDGPMIVLVNQFSASASEILAAALQDYGRALVIGGEHTHGKGTVQALVDLNQNIPLLHFKKYDDLGALKLTIQKFYRINGQSTQFKGVDADIVVPGIFDYLESGEQYLENALKWDTVNPVQYDVWKGPGFDVDKSRQVGRKRIEASARFAKIRQESRLAEERSARTRINLSLQSMIAERKETERIRQEMLAMGNQDVRPEENTEDSQPADLDEQLAEDPVVELASYLMQEPGATQGTVSWRR